MSKVPYSQKQLGFKTLQNRDGFIKLTLRKDGRRYFP